MPPADRAAALAIELSGGDRRLALGTMALAGVYGPVAGEDARHTLDAAWDLGIRMFDTAPLYGDGIVEELLGLALAGRPATIVTKFGLLANRDGRLRMDSRPASVRRSVESSLRRLRRERIDVLLQHRPDPTVSDEELGDVLTRLVEEGKVARVGLSGCDEDLAERMRTTAPISAIQNELSAGSPAGAERSPCAYGASGLVFMAHSPLARGLIASGARDFGRDDMRRSMARLAPAEQTATLDRIRERGVPSGEQAVGAALRWVLGHGRNVIAVVGARSAAQVRACVEQLQLAPMQQEEPDEEAPDLKP